jgi:hypothetical protein
MVVETVSVGFGIPEQRIAALASSGGEFVGYRADSPRR